MSAMKRLAFVLVTSKESMMKCAMKKKYAPLAQRLEQENPGNFSQTTVAKRS